MTRPVSIVLPSLENTDLLEANLPVLIEALERRGQGDQVLVVDDTGEGVLEPWLAEHFPSVVCVTRPENGGFAQALTSGVAAAEHELVFSMNTDVRVRRGFLDPLVACLDDPDVFSVVPRVLLDGDEERVESLTEVELSKGLLEIRQRGLSSGDGSEAEGTTERRLPFHPVPVAFAVGGTCLFRKTEFLATGFDPIYEPFYLEDLDLCWGAWQRGKRTLYQPGSIVEHHHRGTIGKRVPMDVVRAAIEKNRLLFLWKNLDDPELLAEHVAALYRMAIDGWLRGERRELVWLNLALEQAQEALAGRSSDGEGFAAIVDATRGA